MATGITIDFDLSKIEKLAAGLTEKQMLAAWRRALRKTSRWVHTQVARQMSQQTKIPQKAIKARLRTYMSGQNTTAKVWLGASALQPKHLGKVRQTSKGVTAGRFRFPGAFTRKIKDPHGVVFRRVGKSRLPIERVLHPIDDPAEAVFNDVAKKIDDRLMTILLQEVNYEIHKATNVI